MTQLIHNRHESTFGKFVFSQVSRNELPALCS